MTGCEKNCLSVMPVSGDGCRIKIKVWDMAFEGVTTNGMFAYLWQGVSNAFLRAECPTNAAGPMMPRTLTYLDSEYDGLTNEVGESFSLCRHDETNGFWGSTYSITGPREEIGMPKFTDRNAFIVRVGNIGMAGSNIGCTITTLDGDGEETSVEVTLTQQPDGSFKSELIVPVLDLDADADLGLEANYVRLLVHDCGSNVYQYEGSDIKAVINIGILGDSARRIWTDEVSVKFPALFSALLTNEEFGQLRGEESVVNAGLAALSHLHYDVTPLFTPTAEQLLTMIPRHRVWVHNGHGSYVGGIVIAENVSGTYRARMFTAKEIAYEHYDYDLVFMNTCESTDICYKPLDQFPIPQALVNGWSDPIQMDVHAVYDIGLKLKAKNYIGWDCSIERRVSVYVPKKLMLALDTQAGEPPTTVEQAVKRVRTEIRDEKLDFWWYHPRLRAVVSDETVFDMNKKPY